MSTERERERRKLWDTLNPLKRRAYSRKANLAKYGLTFESYDALLKKQFGLCAVCLDLPEENALFCVDHDHATGIVRGLLCRKCNSALGLLNESPRVIRRAAAYVDSWGNL